MPCILCHICHVLCPMIWFLCVVTFPYLLYYFPVLCPICCVPCHANNAMHHISCILFFISHVVCPMSYTPYPWYHIWCPMFCDQYPVSCFLLNIICLKPVFHVLCPKSCSPCPLYPYCVYCVQYSVKHVLYPILYVLCPVSFVLYIMFPISCVLSLSSKFQPCISSNS